MTAEAAVKARPILFSGEMVRAILEERKTQTRRVMKPQPVEVGKGQLVWKEGTGRGAGAPIKDAGWWFGCPYGNIGDRLWVCETWMKERFPSDGSHRYHYRADDTAENTGWTAARMWKPSIHMPREASRLTLEIVGVRVERVQDISEDDAKAEGVTMYGHLSRPIGSKEAPTRVTAYEAFSVLWNNINEERGFGWERNPWVWVIDFKRID